MKVSELIEYLEDYDEDAEVLFMGQPHYPFEYSLKRIVFSREELLNGSGGTDAQILSNGRKLNDVFLVESSQLRYGSRAAWDW